MHAEPTTFGLSWPYGMRKWKGTWSGWGGPKNEWLMERSPEPWELSPTCLHRWKPTCAKSAVEACAISNQIIQRDRHASSSPPWRLSPPPWKRLPWKSAISKERKWQKPKSPSPEGRRGLPPCPTRGTPSARKTWPASPGFSGEMPGLPGKRGPLARTGYQPLFRGAGDRPGQYDSPGLHARPDDPDDGSAGGLPGNMMANLEKSRG